MRKGQQNERKREKAVETAGCILAVFIAFLFAAGGLCYNEEKWSSEGLWEVRSAGAPAASSGEGDAKKIALTYDDGPNPVYTKQLLEVLEQNGVKASFFLLGKNAEAYPSVVRELSKRGHLIGNHTYSHQNLCRIAPENAMEECRRTNRAIERICGEAPDFFRPPFGCAPETLEKDGDMVKVLWDVDPRDWECRNPDTVVRRVMERAEEGDIILLHDSYASTVEATKRLIPLLKEAGYEFVTVDALLLP